MARKIEREYSYEIYRIADYDPLRTEGYFQIPTMQPCHEVPHKLIGFENIRTQSRYDQGVHFFVFDSRFERFWRRPEAYIPKLKQFQCCLAPDFSQWRDMPIAQRLYNHYRKMLMCQIMQDHGIKTIPVIGFSTEESYRFCFDGMPRGGTMAVSTVGIHSDPYAIQLWKEGMEEAIKRLSPDTILLWGKPIDFDFKEIQVVKFDNLILERS